MENCKENMHIDVRVSRVKRRRQRFVMLSMTPYLLRRCSYTKKECDEDDGLV